MRKKIIFFIMLFAFITLLFSSSLYAVENINVVVLANKGHKEAIEKWQPLSEYLRKKPAINSI
jgi:ABC-type phosphate/phosphonate transport system substrate-binding protein